MSVRLSYRTAADYDRDGLTPPRWCGSVKPRLNDKGRITCPSPRP